MGNDDELDFVSQVAQCVAEAAHVGLVEHGVHLVKNHKRGGADAQQRKNERLRRQRTLAAGEQGHTLQPFAGRAGRNINPGFDHIIGVGQQQFGLAAAKERLEIALKLFGHLLKGVGKGGFHRFIKFGNHLAQVEHGLFQIVDLLS